MAYDLFGTGKTALKASASRGVEQDSVRYARANNPATTVQTSTSRVWTDANGNFTPDCELLLSAANGECGAWQTPDFGSTRPGTRYDRAIMEGWGERPWNWEFSAGVQHEIVPRVSASFGWFRRIQGNFFITDNEAFGRGDFTQFSVVAPTSDDRLPTAGQTVGGFYDQNRIVAASNVVKNASDFGKQKAHWNGVDLAVDVRLQNGLFLQGGVSTGRTMTDNCDIVDDVPELLGSQSADYCHVQTPFEAQYKALAAYALPYGVRVSGTYQSIPGPQIAANNIYVGTVPSLGRPFTLGQANVNLIRPGTMYGDRLNQFDLRFSKLLNVGRGRLDLSLNLYNAFNSDAILTQQNAFGTAWQRPLTVIQPRFVKLMARWDF